MKRLGLIAPLIAAAVLAVSCSSTSSSADSSTGGSTSSGSTSSGSTSSGSKTENADEVATVEETEEIFASSPTTWSEHDIVDSFGEPSGEKCILGECQGTFSNSATAGSSLGVIIRKDQIGVLHFRFMEYNRILGNMSGDRFKIVFYVRNKDRRLTEVYSKYMSEDETNHWYSVYISKENLQKLFGYKTVYCIVTSEYERTHYSRYGNYHTYEQTSDRYQFAFQPAEALAILQDWTIWI